MQKISIFKILMIALAGTIVPLLLITLSSMLIYGANYPLVKFYYWKGYIEQKNGNLNEAINSFNKVTALDNSHTFTYISRGSAYLDSKKYTQAIENYSKAIELSPNCEEAYAYRGRAYYEIDSINNSLLDYNKAIQLNEEFSYPYTNRALLKYTKLNDYNGACEDLNKAAQLGDKEANYQLEQGVCK